MGVLDHRRTWQFDVAASADDCLSAFGRAFTGRGGLVAKASWAVRRTGSGSVAVYEGRKGIGALGGMVSRTAAHEADTAVGSEVTFSIDENKDGRTICSMWLSKSGRAGIAGMFGVTADARFIRPYMQAVQKEMLALDTSARIATV